MAQKLATVLFSLALCVISYTAFAADRLTGVHSARVMSQSLPWIAEEAGLFRKYDVEFRLVYIGSSPLATAAMLGGDGELLMDGGLGIVRAYVQGNTQLVCIGGQKNILTQSILAKPPIKRLEDLRGKKVGVTRIGSTTHYFAIEAFRRIGMEAGRDYTVIQTGGAPEMLAALVSGAIEGGTLAPPLDAQAIAQGFQYIVYGPDLRIPQVAVAFMTRRSTLVKRPEVLGRFIRAMAEAAKILHTDKEFTFKVLSKELRITERKTLETGYNAEIKVLEPRLAIRPEAFQAILDDVAQSDARAKKIKPADFIDRRFLDEMTKSGFFDKLWGEKS
jgi:ABC-type nitrate/sulfonate/bicarbonate transport system substrate-binding protein